MNNNILNYKCFFNSSKIVLIQKNLNRSGSKNINSKSLLNLEKKGTTSSIKSGSQSRIEKFLSQWLKALYYNAERAQEINAKPDRLPVFVTLTLPAQQIHSDTLIKRECLMPLIAELKRNFSVKNYFWKAELQKNYNIHFHLILDSYIPYKSLQQIWNRHLNKLNYVDRFEKKHNKVNPPSTHVEKIDNVGKAIKYVSKYVCKSDMSGVIDGRKWEASKELKGLKPMSYWLDSEIEEYVNYLIDNDKVDCFHSEYFSVLFFSKKFDYNNDYGFIKNIEKKDCLSTYDALYTVDSRQSLVPNTKNERVKPVPYQLSLDMYIPLDISHSFD